MRTRTKRRDAIKGQPNPTTKVAEMVTEILLAHEEQQAKQQDTAALVARIVEENNEKLLNVMREMVNDALVHAAARQPRRARGLQQTAPADGTAAARSLNVESASMWLEDDNGRVVFGANGDTDIKRTGAGVLSTGALQVSGDADLTCDAESASGTIRWLAEKRQLQVCEGTAQKWKAAGGGVLDAADGEPCSGETPGQMQFDDAADTLEICSGDAYVRVLLAGAHAQVASLAASAGVQLGYDAGACTAEKARPSSAEHLIQYNESAALHTQLITTECSLSLVAALRFRDRTARFGG